MAAPICNMPYVTVALSNTNTVLLLLLSVRFSNSWEGTRKEFSCYFPKIEKNFLVPSQNFEKKYCGFCFVFLLKLSRREYFKECAITTCFFVSQAENFAQEFYLIVL